MPAVCTQQCSAVASSRFPAAVTYRCLLFLHAVGLQVQNSQPLSLFVLWTTHSQLFMMHLHDVPAQSMLEQGRHYSWCLLMRYVAKRRRSRSYLPQSRSHWSWPWPHFGSYTVSPLASCSAALCDCSVVGPSQCILVDYLVPSALCCVRLHMQPLPVSHTFLLSPLHGLLPPPPSRPLAPSAALCLPLIGMLHTCQLCLALLLQAGVASDYINHMRNCFCHIWSIVTSAVPVRQMLQTSVMVMSSASRLLQCLILTLDVHKKFQVLR